MPKPDRGSISQHLPGLKSGDEFATHEVWQRYFDQLVQLARKKLGSAPRRDTDEEDIALGAMESLFRGAVSGRFSELQDRSDLWMILVAITKRKVVDKLRHDQRQKHGSGETRGDSIFTTADPCELAGFDQVAGSIPTPQLLAEMDEEQKHLLAALPEDLMRRIACLRLEGDCNDEISQLLAAC